MTIDLWFFLKFCTYEEYNKKMWLNAGFVKIHIQYEKIFNGFVVLVYNQVYCQSLSKI